MIDTHQHFWRLDRGDYSWLTPDLAALYRNFGPEDLAPLLKAAGVTGTIAVQAADSEAETEYLLSLADAHDWILGVVGWVDLAAPHAVRSIDRLARHPKLVGLRPMIQDLADDAWMLGDALRPAIAAMIRNDLTFDALVMPRHLGHLRDFLARYPDLRVVVDHCAKPEIRNQGYASWATAIDQIAAVPGVFCKISGLVTEASADWAEPDLAPYIAHVRQIFGPDRLLFGSDWPVVNLAADYGQWHRIAMAEVDAGDPQDRQDFETGNSLRAYPRLQS